MKLATDVSLGEIFQKQKWFVFCLSVSEVSGGGGGGRGYHLRPPNHDKTCSYRGEFGIV